MSNWPVQRRFPRYPVEIPFLHTTTAPGSAGTGAGWTRDLSEGGACVELNERLQVPSPLHIHLQTDRGAIEIEAQVVWEAQAPKGGTQGSATTAGGVLHGVAFTHLAPDQLLALRALLPPHGQERRSGIRLPIDLPVTCRPKGPEGSSLQGRNRKYQSRRALAPPFPGPPAGHSSGTHPSSPQRTGHGGRRDRLGGATREADARGTDPTRLAFRCPRLVQIALPRSLADRGEVGILTAVLHRKETSHRAQTIGHIPAPPIRSCISQQELWRPLL